MPDAMTQPSVGSARSERGFLQLRSVDSTAKVGAPHFAQTPIDPNGPALTDVRVRGSEAFRQTGQRAGIAADGLRQGSTSLVSRLWSSPNDAASVERELRAGAPSLRATLEMAGQALQFARAPDYLLIASPAE